MQGIIQTLLLQRFIIKQIQNGAFSYFFACFIKQKASARLFQTAWRS
jgi:hypothetical protein